MKTSEASLNSSYLRPFETSHDKKERRRPTPEIRDMWKLPAAGNRWRNAVCPPTLISTTRRTEEHRFVCTACKNLQPWQMANRDQLPAQRSPVFFILSPISWSVESSHGHSLLVSRVRRLGSISDSGLMCKCCLCLVPHVLSIVVPQVWLIVPSLSCVSPVSSCLHLPPVFKPRVPFHHLIPVSLTSVWSVFRVSISKFSFSLIGTFA